MMENLTKLAMLCHEEHMIRQCAGCKLILGECPPLRDTRISHGYCDDCFDVEMEKIQEYKRICEQKKKKVA